ncbi:hypothetical protein M0R45_035801 [Rubus argutus]|uniref:Uncharacterized protein n=1 Tax=Rubus argutus TaxID=59490 RepID=A0AAW1VXY7_RUBAR
MAALTHKPQSQTITANCSHKLNRELPRPRARSRALCNFRSSAAPHLCHVDGNRLKQPPPKPLLSSHAPDLRTSEVSVRVRETKRELRQSERSRKGSDVVELEVEYDLGRSAYEVAPRESIAADVNRERWRQRHLDGEGAAS